MRWEKIGRFIEPLSPSPWHKSHAMLPIADQVDGNVYKILFSGRDEENRSHICAVIIDVNDPLKILDRVEQPILRPGELGCFDDNGVSPSCLLDMGREKLLYYIGWKPRCTTRMTVVAGLAKSVDGGETFQRVSRAPILQRTNLEPFGIMTAPWVIKDGNTYRMWYVSGTGWVHADLPTYNIKIAESVDGINWVQHGVVAINNRDSEETSLARPCVLKQGGIYKMWYSYKHKSSRYLMGYAESTNGIDWKRLDDQIGISPSRSGWDSEMVEYGSVFEHEGNMFMLYNGNGYGASGAGIAVLLT